MSEKSITPDGSIPIYFQPGQLIFHARDNWRAKPDMIKDLIDWAKKVANEFESSIEISDSPEIFDFSLEKNLHPQKVSSLYRSRTILRESQSRPHGVSPNIKTRYISPSTLFPNPFSLVFTDYTSKNWPNPNIETYSKDVTEEKSAARANALKKALFELLDLAIYLDNRRYEAPIELEVVSLNWVMSGGRDEPDGTGGPGGKPSPVVNNANIPNETYQILPNLNNITNSPELFAGISDDQDPTGDGVDVAILDTSYSIPELEDILKKWVLDRQNDPHPIIRKLLSNDPQELGALRDAGKTLRVHTNSSVDSYLPGLKIAGHDYVMTDHGLFVAGIINTIAPKARLHLYQVLNQYGLGDLRSIARALEDVHNNFQDMRLVVNLSLTMNMPLEKKHLKAKDTFKIGRAILKRRPWWLARKVSKVFNWLFNKEHLCCCDSWFERQAYPFERICDLIYALDSRVIAAAGNEAKNRNQRPGALFPAAFERVLGVGALTKDDGSVVPASYSNLADKPTIMGITTFGGEPGAGNGILGVYVGDFPEDDNGNRPRNSNGWAWWCGTSFATPAISGTTAAVLSKMPGAITEEAIRKLFEAQIDFTGDMEDVFTTTQG